MTDGKPNFADNKRTNCHNAKKHIHLQLSLPLERRYLAHHVFDKHLRRSQHKIITRELLDFPSDIAVDDDVLGCEFIDIQWRLRVRAHWLAQRQAAPCELGEVYF